MNRFTIHYCGEEKVINILIDGVLPTTAFTIGASGGVIEVPYSGCASSVTIDSSVTYTIDGANHKILLNMPSNSSDTERVFNFSVVWCDGNSTDAVITQAESNGFYQDTLIAPFTGGTLVASYHGCLSSITISGVSYSIDSTNKTVTFVVPENRQSIEIIYDFVAYWCDGTSSNERITQNAYIRTEYLTFRTLEDAEFAFVKNQYYGNDLEYSLDSGSTWEIFHSSRTVFSETFPSGTTIMWRGYSPMGRFYSTGRFEAYGNPLSIISGDSYDEVTVVRGGAFDQLFKETDIVSAENLILTATTLGNTCYHLMFAGCTSLTTAPELPATTLANHCYDGMFSGCTSLTSAPELPATTLADWCYTNMFVGCTSLTTAPELPATTLTSGCYDEMFNDCILLTSAPELPATTLAESCYDGMFEHCTSLTTAPVLSATTLAERCYAYMFLNCTSLTTAPVLSAMTLADSCYYGMFGGCISLISAPELPATTLQNGCYYDMFSGCTSLTTAPVLSATTLAESCYREMFSGCHSLTTAPSLPATTLAESCYYAMFRNCTGLTTAQTLLPATTMAYASYQEMFKGCTSLTTAPELPATTLISYCYYEMFYGCSRLNYIKAMFLTQSTNYTSNWVYGVASTGTFVKNTNATWTATGASAVPYYWTIEYANP